MYANHGTMCAVQMLYVMDPFTQGVVWGAPL